METIGKNTVRRYKIIAFVIKENIPKVIKFNGKEIRLRSGFRSRNIMYKTLPAKA